MKAINSLDLRDKIDQLEKIFISSLPEHMSIAKKEKQIFLDTNFEIVKQSSTADHFTEVLHYCKIYCLFPDNEVLQKFKDIGFGKLELQWFVAWSEIERELDCIEKRKKLVFDKEKIFETVRIYLINRLIGSLALLYTYKNEKGFQQKMINAYQKFLRRKTEKVVNPQKARKTKHDVAMNTTAEIFNQRGDSQFFYKDMHKIIRQDTNKIILGRNFKKQFQRNKGVTLNEFYRELFDLLKIIVLDKIFYTNAEYDNKSFEVDESKKENKKKSYQQSYIKYQSRRVFNLLFREE